MTARRSDGAFRPDIEGLRAVAVLLVVACHCGVSWCAGGFVGVDVFFVLSGYLITRLLAAEYRATSRLDLRNFYARRARRLVPACALVLLATVSGAAVVLAPQELASTGRAALSAGLYLSNVFFDHGASDYFAPSLSGNPLLHTWSLGLEEQFYLLWPLLMLAAARGPQRAQRSVWTFGAVTVLSFACSVWLTRWAPTAAFYELPARAWEFAAGGLLAFAPVAQTPRDARWPVACGMAGLVVVLATGVLARGGAGFPGWIAFFPVAGTIATLYAGAAAPQRGASALLATAPLQFVGARSYSWYLWHWPLVVFAGALFPRITVGGKAVAAAASLVAATLTFRFVERPVRESDYLAARPGLSLRLAGGAILLTAVASWALLLFGQQLLLDATFRSIGAATTDVADISQKECVDQGLVPAVRTCVFGAVDAPRTIVLFGDSHAVQWFNPLRTAATMEAWRLVTVLKSGCSASDINPHALSTTADVCREWRTRAIAQIIALHPTVVVMASYTGATMRGFRAEAPMSVEELRLGTRRILQMLSAAGLPVVVLRDSPLPPFDIPACVGRHAQEPSAGAACDFEASAALNEAAFAAERAAADGLPRVYFLSLSDLICPGNSCPATQHGLLVYRDDNHLTGAFAQSLAPSMRARLFQLLRDAQSP